MMEFINKINQNPIVILVLSILAVVGFVGWIAGIKRKRISIKKVSNVLIHNAKEPHEKLNILFDNQKIENMTTTLITVWNSGNEVIKDSDTIKEYPWKIVSSENSIILEVKLLVSTANGLHVEKVEDHEVQVKFDSFDKKEGAVFQIVHTGDDSDIDFIYRILGGKKDTYHTDLKHDQIKHAFISGVSAMIPRRASELLGMGFATLVMVGMYFGLVCFSNDEYCRDLADFYKTQNTMNILYDEKSLTDFVQHLTSKTTAKFNLLAVVMAMISVGMIISGVSTSTAIIPKELRKYASFDSEKCRQWIMTD